MNKKLCQCSKLWGKLLSRVHQILQSAKRRFEESLDELSDKAGIMIGDGYSKHINKRKTKEANRIRKKRKNNKRTIDIFDKK